MPWEYSQSSGVMARNGIPVGDPGYSGKGPAKNRPEMESVAFAGPIPAGTYRIGGSHTHAKVGPVVMGLTPVGHDAHGRTHFLIHGDSIKDPGKASDGCIAVGLSTRKAIAKSGDTTLEVVP